MGILLNQSKRYSMQGRRDSQVSSESKLKKKLSGAYIKTRSYSRSNRDQLDQGMMESEGEEKKNNLEGEEESEIGKRSNREEDPLELGADPSTKQIVEALNKLNSSIVRLEKSVVRLEEKFDNRMSKMENRMSKVEKRISIIEKEVFPVQRPYLLPHQKKKDRQGNLFSQRSPETSRSRR